MTVLRPSPVSTNRFTYISADRMFVAEASDLPEFGRVYDDACDVGLTLISARTGKEMVVTVNHTERDQADGEFLYWDLVPADLRMPPAFTVRVYND